jgi:hypothetical protein
METALWTAVRSLREKSLLLRQMANNAREGGKPELADRLDEQAGGDERSLELIRSQLLGGDKSPITAKQRPNPGARETVEVETQAGDGRTPTTDSTR